MAFQRVCLEEAALGGRAGLRAGSGFGPGRMGRVGVGPGSGPAGSGRAKLRSGWAGSNFGSGRGGFGVRWARGRAGLLQAGSGRAGSGSELRLSYTPVRAFAILKRTNADSGVCEINAHLNKILQLHSAPRPPEVQCCRVFRTPLCVKSGRLFRSPKVPPTYQSTLHFGVRGWLRRQQLHFSDGRLFRRHRIQVSHGSLTPKRATLLHAG